MERGQAVRERVAGAGVVTREELNKRIDAALEENRAAIERADAHFREFRRLAAIHTVKTERVFRELRESARRR